MPGLLWPGILLCAFLALGVVAHDGPLPGDAALAAAVPHLALLEIVSAAAAVVPWTAGTLVVGGLLWLAGRKGWAAALVSADLAVETAVLVTKLVVDRARPVAGLPADLITSASFPSGHVARVGVVLGIVMLSVHWPHPSVRVTAAIVAVAAVALLALARITSGEHWPSDVLGSLLLAGAVVGLADALRWR